MKHQRDHGGDLARAIQIYGGAEAAWIDLSTGINRTPYNYDIISEKSFLALPESNTQSRLLNAAQTAFRTDWPIVALPGAQAGIQLLPRLLHPGTARVLCPTYNEYEATFREQGWQVDRVEKLSDLHSARVAVVVNPNNPTGTCLRPEDLIELTSQVDLLVVDESFMDPTPEGSLLPRTMPENVIVLRSFGKFFGLAGLRLGFALGSSNLVTQLARFAGPWAVSGPALEVGAKAYADADWQSKTRVRLARDAARCDALAKPSSWSLIGGTALFRTYETPDAEAAQNHLAAHHIWSRIFPYSRTWIRLGLPGSDVEWERVEAALNDT